MLNQITEIAPAGALAAAAVWGGLSYFVTGPEIATRKAQADYIAACEETISTAITSHTQGAIDQTQQLSELERQAQMTRNYVNSMRRQYGELWEMYDRLSGGALSEAVRQAEAAERAAKNARKRAGAALQSRRDLAISSAPDQCSCQIKAALNESRSDWAIFVGTFTIVQNDGVANFPALMRANGRMCAERVQA